VTLFAVNWIVWFVKLIVTGVAPTPETLRTLLNQMNLLGGILVPLKFDAMEADRGAQSTSSPAGHAVAPADSTQTPCEPRTVARNTRAHARS
jgi:hypothetical protein